MISGSLLDLFIKYLIQNLESIGWIFRYRRKLIQVESPNLKIQNLKCYKIQTFWVPWKVSEFEALHFSDQGYSANVRVSFSLLTNTWANQPIKREGLFRLPVLEVAGCDRAGRGLLGRWWGSGTKEQEGWGPTVTLEAHPVIWGPPTRPRLLQAPPTPSSTTPKTSPLTRGPEGCTRSKLWQMVNSMQTFQNQKNSNLKHLRYQAFQIRVLNL